MSSIGISLFQCLLGIQCKDFTMIAADQMNTQSIIVLKNDEDKLHQVSDRLIMGMNGTPGDRLQFAHFIAKNVHLYEMKNGYKLDTAAVVHFTRKNLADGLKGGESLSNSPLEYNLSKTKVTILQRELVSTAV